MSIKTQIIKGAIKIHTSEGQQKDITCKKTFLGTEIDCDSETVVFEIGFFFSCPRCKLQSIQLPNTQTHLILTGSSSAELGIVVKHNINSHLQGEETCCFLCTNCPRGHSSS